MKQATAPLFQFDPGWLFIVAGLAICAAGIALPAQGDLEALQVQLEQLRAEEIQAYARLKAHSDFLDQVDRADPALTRRLAAAQLNVVPERDTPILLAVSKNSPVTDWIDTTVNVDIRPPKAVPVSALSRMANGPFRLWLFGAGIMSVFMGLLMAPAPLRVRVGRKITDDNTAFERFESKEFHGAMEFDDVAENDQPAESDAWDDESEEEAESLRSGFDSHTIPLNAPDECADEPDVDATPASPVHFEGNEFATDDAVMHDADDRDRAGG